MKSEAEKRKNNYIKILIFFKCNRGQKNNLKEEKHQIIL